MGKAEMLFRDREAIRNRDVCNLSEQGSVLPNSLEIDVSAALSAADTPPLALVPRSEPERSPAGRDIDAASRFGIGRVGAFCSGLCCFSSSLQTGDSLGF